MAPSVTYTATLKTRRETVQYLAALLHAKRVEVGTRAGTRALGPFEQAVMVIRWFLDGTRVAGLGHDNHIARSTAYDYLHEGIDVLAAKAPGLDAALAAARAAGCAHLNLDGTVIRTDRIAALGPNGCRPVVVRETQAPRRERPGAVGPGRLAAVDLRRASRP